MGNINIGQDEDKPTLTDLIDPEPQKVDLAIGNADDLNLASIDADLTIRSITPCMARALGFEASEVLGKRFLELLNPEDREHLEGTVRGALESMGAVEIGKVRPYSKAEGASELQLKAVVLEGAPSSVLLVGVTSPAQETASERPSSFELANRTHAWDNLISFSIDKDHKFIDFNARIGTMTGKVPRDMLGRDIREILDQDLAFQSEFDRCLTSVLSGDIRTADLPVLNRSGATVKIRCRLQPIMDSKGQIVGVTILGHETSAINL
jgi:PAS domain S-box-containing protein